MKILLVCAGGLSSSIVMKKVEKYAGEIGEDISIDAVGVPQVKEVYKNYDCVLTAPQVRNRNKQIEETCQGVPVAALPPADYAIGNAKNVVALAKKISNK